MAYAVTGLPFGLIPRRIVVTQWSGSVEQVTWMPFPLALVPILGNTISTLAPYSMPLMAMTAAALMPAGKALVVGLLLGYHLWCKPKEIRDKLDLGSTSVEGHTDISGAGYIISATMIPAMALASYGWMLDVLVDGLSAGTARWLATFLPAEAMNWQRLLDWTDALRHRIGAG